MKAQIIQRYDHPDQFLPLMPADSVLGPLLERASDLNRAALALGNGAVPASTQVELRALLRAMNSYYTNRLEGEHTRPSEIDSALKKDFSTDRNLARKQRLAVAHIDTERHCETVIDERLAQGEDTTRWLYSTEAVMWLHKHLFEALGDEDRTLEDGSIMVPGELRQRQVAVGRHEAPSFEAVPRFLERWSAVYGAVRRGEAAIVAACASHHRLAWLHPLPDGNGRVARLHTHLLLYAMQLTSGLWSPLRGFARTEERYRALLAAADEHRRGDLDGRGNLTQAGLVEWISYVLDVCIDQVSFMTQQLDVTGMRDRIEASILYDCNVQKLPVRPEVVGVLHYLFTSGIAMPRADFKAMSKLGDRVATGTLSALLKLGYLATDSAYGDVRFAIPRHALRFYFPLLWPEAEQDQAALEVERRTSRRVGMIE